MQNYESVLLKIEEYKDKFHSLEIQDFSINQLYNLFPENMESPNAWPKPYPHPKNPGVYLFFDRDKNLIYIGKASMNNTIGSRLCYYFAYSEDKRCKINHNWKNGDPKYILIISFAPANSYFAPALEEYLIKELNPPENINGKKIVFK